MAMTAGLMAKMEAGQAESKATQEKATDEMKAGQAQLKASIAAIQADAMATLERMEERLGEEMEASQARLVFVPSLEWTFSRVSCLLASISGP